jgi:hypothetical protein
MRKFLCFIGYHRFSFLLSELPEGESIPKYGMPAWSKCQFCGKHYDKNLAIDIVNN